MQLEPVIGLEVHSELKTRTKMFCDSRNDPDETHANINVCPICLGHPGTLPVINREAVSKIIHVGLALNGDIAGFSQFDRKNYFYPDLPKGYQISQYQHPLVRGGYLEIPATPLPSAHQIRNPKSPPSPEGYGQAGEIRNNSQIQNSNDQNVRRIRIQRVHMEEDTGRSVHDPKSKTTLLDFNRAGIPLMELVTEPDLASAAEARRFAEELQLILQYLGASDANMEKGEMRIEANVSLRPAGSSELGTKVELKNINSFRFVERAIEYEINRQLMVLEQGGKIVQETRGWDEARGETVSQRLKEESRDYRYFPEPDLPPLSIPPSLVEELRARLPELPRQKLLRFMEEFGIDAKLAAVIVRDKAGAGFFEAAISELREWLKSTGKDPADPTPLRLAANYLTTDLAKILTDSGTPIGESLVTPENFAELITYIYEGRISSRTAKDVLREMFSTGADPSVVIEEKKLWQVSEAGDLAAAVERIIAANPKAVADYTSGKAAALQFLLGQVMKEAKGANPETVRRLLENLLKSDFNRFEENP